MLLNKLKHDGAVVVQWANTGSSGNTHREGDEVCFVISMKEKLACRKLPYVIDNRLAESLRVNVREETTLWEECATGHLVKMRKWTVG